MGKQVGGWSSRWVGGRSDGRGGRDGTGFTSYVRRCTRAVCIVCSFDLGKLINKNRLREPSCQRLYSTDPPKLCKVEKANAKLREQVQKGKQKLEQEAERKKKSAEQLKTTKDAHHLVLMQSVRRAGGRPAAGGGAG